MPDLSKELASLLAMLFTDGGVSPKEKNSWRIYFSNSSEILIQLFQDCVAKIFGLERKRIRIKVTLEGFHKVVINSKEIGNYLVRRFGTFRTLKYKDGKWPDIKLPIDQLITSNVVDEFLKVAFSCDGGLCFYPAYREGPRGGTKWLIRTVFLSCHHPKLRKDYLTLLRFLGIRARDVPQDGKIKIEDENNIRKFKKLVGFARVVR